MKLKISKYSRLSARILASKNLDAELKSKIPKNNSIKVKIKGKLIPQYKSEQAAGCDLFADIANEVILKPGDICAIPTGIKIAIPEGYEAQVRPRSGLAREYGIGVMNAPGTIDADYRGEVKVILFNFGKKALTIRKHDRIAQLVFNQIARAEFQRVRVLEQTKRGKGGFGHTGRRRKGE